ncbi:HAD family hydrolase [Amphibacillus sediminis]|uniref:HAD family hydrolase n=1 Tax=Amphibacillus sediminis TaxID=360185 RepID=UPI00082EC12E|nr:HAD family hydrolase [Amphibacillus sediminis]
MIKAVIFDFDGTLANTLPICYKAFQHVFQTYDNRKLSDHEVREMFGPSETGIIRGNLQDSRVEEAIEVFYQQYHEQHNQLVSPNQDIQSLLTYLTDNGIQLAIVTGKARRSLNISLQALHLDYDFEAIITGDDVNMPKPDPEGIYKALNILGVDASEAIYVGDSEADIEAGKAAGTFTVGVQWLPEYQSEAFVREPDLVCRQVSDLIKHIDA